MSQDSMEAFQAGGRDQMGYAIRLTDGALAPNTSMSLGGDYILISDADRITVWSWHRVTGAVRAFRGRAGGFGNLGLIAVAGDTLFVPSADLNLSAWSLSTGALLFTVRSRVPLNSVVACGDVGYLQDADITAIDRRTGRAVGTVYRPSDDNGQARSPAHPMGANAPNRPSDRCARGSHVTGATSRLCRLTATAGGAPRNSGITSCPNRRHSSRCG